MTIAAIYQAFAPALELSTGTDSSRARKNQLAGSIDKTAVGRHVLQFLRERPGVWTAMGATVVVTLVTVAMGLVLMVLARNSGRLLVAVGISFFVIWIWILITILTDLFRDYELSGWWKAVWLPFLVFVPFLAVLIYLIARGSGMGDRTIKAQAGAKQRFDEYVRTQAHSAPADQLQKLNDLKEKGALSPEEFDKAKAKLLG